MEKYRIGILADDTTAHTTRTVLEWSVQMDQVASMISSWTRSDIEALAVVIALKVDRGANTYNRILRLHAPREGLVKRLERVPKTSFGALSSNDNTAAIGDPMIWKIS